MAAGLGLIESHPVCTWDVALLILMLAFCSWRAPSCVLGHLLWCFLVVPDCILKAVVSCGGLYPGIAVAQLHEEKDSLG